MARLFGTDGVRGVAGEELSYELAVALGRAAVRKLGGRIVIGRDTRVSGPMLEEGLRAGIAAEGASAPALLGVIPTPGLAWYTVEEGFDCGIMITASHNAPEYNGIKFFSSKGFKLPDEVEDEMQAVVEELLGQPVGQPPAGQLVEDAVERFVAHDIAPLQEEGLSLAGMHIALDCAHGAACASTPLALERLGAQVTAINTEPDGSIINVECGSTHLGPVTELMRACGADIALAHDGDADRLLAVAPGGTVCDGDFILAICAKDMQERGTLSANTVVGTVMANLGFMQAMELVSREMDAPLGSEFRKVIGEMNVGSSLEKALSNMSKRMESSDFDLVVTAVLIQRQVGGNLSQILDTISDTIRERIRMKAEILTLTAQGRFSGLILLALPFVVCGFIMIVNPGYLQPMLSSTAGKIALLLGMILEFIGYVVIKRIVNIDCA